MITEFEFFHGAVFSRILHGAKTEVRLSAYRDDDNATYVINDKVGLYIKYSTKRLTPWRFSFLKKHQEHIILVMRFHKFSERNHYNILQTLQQLYKTHTNCIKSYNIVLDS
jgi:hypothetical protein